MNNENIKLNKLAADVLEDARQRSEELLRQAAVEHQNILDEEENKILQQSYREIHENIEQVRKQYGRLLSQYEADKRKNLFVTRETLMNSIFDEATKRVLAFTQSKEYPEYLKGIIHAVKDKLSEHCVIILCDKDRSLEETVMESFGKPCTIDYSDEFKLGGIMFKDLDKGYLINEILDSKLNDQKEWFVEACGLSVV